jgi:DNA topoisomerase-1
VQRLQKYTLIITEKPDAARRIATALDTEAKPKKRQQNGVPYYEADRNGKIVVAPAIGHLYTVAAVKGQKGYPIFGYQWVPLHLARRGASRTRVWLNALSKLAKDAEAFVDACDYDIEGSIIGYCILKYACGDKENIAKRMKYSTLTEEELQQAYAGLLPHLDFGLIEAGLTRHEVDWLYGINLSRALTAAAKKASNQYVTLSTGRVQGPTLKFLAAREQSIACFVPLPYWTLKAKIKIDNFTFEAQYKKGIIEVKKQAEEAAKAAKTKSGEITSVEAKRVLEAPPAPFDLGALQSEAYRFFGYMPMRTSSIAQRLYLDALISYPRTSSQKLPKEIGYKKILQNLAKNPQYTKLAGQLLTKPKLEPTQGKKTDSAHPAIYPTGKQPHKELSPMERNVYDLVVRRFLAVFGEPAVKENVKATVDLNGEEFVLEGTRVLERGWLGCYEGSRVKETPLPSIQTGQQVAIQRVVLEDKFTKPPSRYNPSSVVKKMEAGNIGTKATRANILQTLYDRNYIQNERICVTDLGFEVTDVLRRFCPSVVSVEFTRRLEEKMGQIEQGKEKREKTVLDAVENLKLVASSLKANDDAVGDQLSRAVKQANLQERLIGPCPTCHSGNLIIQYSKKTKKRFVGCTNYFNGACKTAFPLPQRGYVKPTGKPCKGCGWLTVQVWLKSKRPWTLCLNPQCSLKASEAQKK